MGIVVEKLKVIEKSEHYEQRVIVFNYKYNSNHLETIHNACIDMEDNIHNYRRSLIFNKDFNKAVKKHLKPLKEMSNDRELLKEVRDFAKCAYNYGDAWGQALNMKSRSQQFTALHLVSVAQRMRNTTSDAAVKARIAVKKIK